MNSDALRGHIEMLLLGALEAGDAHGYALIERIRERSGDVLHLTEGAAYPALHRLEAARVVRSRWDSSAGRRRRVYSLTASGRKRLGVERAAWRDLSVAISRVVAPA